MSMLGKAVIGQPYQLLRLKKSKQSQLLSLMPISFLAACGGGSSQTPAPTPTPAPAPDPDFSESPSNTFTAKDDTDGLTLSEGSNSNDLTVNGKNGNDSITTGSGVDTIKASDGNDTINAGSGNDVIRGEGGNDTINGDAGNDLILGGAGADTINGGDGDDYIVIIGTTTSIQYTSSSITNPAGQDIDLSSLIDLNDDVNGNGTSHLASGETINGGNGNNTLIIYGDVDLSGATILNVDTLWVNSSVTLTLDQLNDFTAVIGDGSSDIIIKAQATAITLNFNDLDIENIDSFTVQGDAIFTISSTDQLSPIGNFTINGDLSVVIPVDSGEIVFSDLSVLGSISSIEIASGVKLDLSGASLSDLINLPALEGVGTIVLANTILSNSTALKGLVFSSDLTFETVSGSVIDPSTLGGRVAADIEIGGSVDASITQVGEEDWYAITLEAGAVYQIDMTGEASGDGTLVDPRIYYIYDANGNPIPNAFNDDGAGENRESSMLFQPAETGTYYISASAWGSETGSYKLAINDVSSDFQNVELPLGPTNRNTIPNVDFNVSYTNRAEINALLAGLRYSSDPDNTTTTITWSFSTSGNFSDRSGFGYDDPGSDDTGAEPTTGFKALTPQQEEAFEELIGHIGSIVNIDFVHVADVSGPTGSPGSAGTIRIGWTGIDQEDVGAWAYFPTTSPVAGDIWLMDGNLSQNLSNHYTRFTMLHELGHALGLKHSFDTENNSTAMPSQYESVEYTVMSYTESVLFPNANNADYSPQTLMYYDILALQHLYGSRDVNEGDTTYTFRGNTRYFETMWDTDGTDTIEFSGQTKGVVMDLSGGQWSDVGTTVRYYNDNTLEGTRKATVFIPDEVDIENVNGTTFSDTIIGGEEDNIFRGLNGNDVLTGGDGNDYLAGGSGEDELRGGDGNDVFVVANGEGVANKSDADMVFDFVDGEDRIGLVGLEYSDLTLEAIDGDTVVKDSNGNILIVLDNITVDDIDSSDFIILADDWYM